MVRKTLIISYILLLLAFLLPVIRSRGGAQVSPGTSPGPSTPSLSADQHRQVTLLVEGERVVMDMHSYLVGVVAAEMPASFPLEALKAQAVAARSYTAYCTALSRHKDAQICANSGCCQAWMDTEQMKERWGADYDKYYERIRESVNATAGEELRYEGQPVFAAFHSSSPGATEDSGQIWNETPYLVSVPSPENAMNLPQLISYVRVSPLDLRDSLLALYPQADFSSEPDKWLGRLEHSPSGRVDSIFIGGVPVEGTRLRQLFSLRSTAFELGWDGQDFVFTVAGFGHGVGMSQYGARLMAEQGADYKSILAHYYPGTSLVS